MLEVKQCLLHPGGSLVGLTANVRLAEDKRTSLLLSDDEETVLQNFLRLKDGERDIAGSDLNILR